MDPDLSSLAELAVKRVLFTLNCKAYPRARISDSLLLKGVVSCPYPYRPIFAMMFKILTERAIRGERSVAAC